MENTNENIEMLEPNGDVAQEVAKGCEEVADYFENLEEIVQEEETTTSEKEEDDDPTMRVLRKFPKVCARIAEIMSEQAESAAMDLLSKGIGYDEAVANADKEGYIRGRNEKIELKKGHRMSQLDEEPASEKETSGMLFPRYEKRSVWENDY